MLLDHVCTVEELIAGPILGQEEACECGAEPARNANGADQHGKYSNDHFQLVLGRRITIAVRGGLDII